MITELTPYPAMKDSGLEWLGDIPDHWYVQRAKWLFRNVERPVREIDEVVTCFRDGTVTLRRNRRLTGFTEALKEIGYQGVRCGDLVIHMMDAFAGAIGVSDSDGKCTPVYAICEAGSLANPHYYARVVREMARRRWLLALSKGVRERSTDFRFAAFADQRLPVAPLSEQAAIVRYLDHVDRRISRYIRAKQRLIELLEEEKQVIIHRAVTRGLDPDVRLKPSGVEWLGDVPEHWEVRRLKTLASMSAGASITALSIEGSGDYPVYGGNGIRGFASTFTHDGDFALIGRQGALCGNVHLARGRFWASEHAVVAALSPGHNLSWFGAALAVMDLNQYSIAAAQPGLAVDRVMNLSLAIPPAWEQKRLSEHLNHETTDIDAASDRARREIELLGEYRTRLIADVVTGKLDVREAAADLSEVDRVDLGDIIEIDGAAAPEFAPELEEVAT